MKLSTKKKMAAGGATALRILSTAWRVPIARKLIVTLIATALAAAGVENLSPGSIEAAGEAVVVIGTEL